MSDELLKACKNGDFKAVKLLIESGVDINYQTDHGITGLMSAAVDGRDEIITLLIANEAKIDLETRLGNTALEIACAEGQLNTVKLLFAAGANIEHLNNTNSNALISAAYWGRTSEIIQFLIEKNVKLDIQDDHGYTALMKSVPYDTPEAIASFKILIENGADINIKNIDGNTVLMLASEHFPFNGKIKLLIENGADLNLQNNIGDTALIVFIKTITFKYYGMIPRWEVDLTGADRLYETYDLFITNGADLNTIKNSKNKTAFDLINEVNDEKLTAYFEKAILDKEIEANEEVEAMGL